MAHFPSLPPRLLASFSFTPQVNLKSIKLAQRTGPGAAAGALRLFNLFDMDFFLSGTAPAKTAAARESSRERETRQALVFITTQLVGSSAHRHSGRQQSSPSISSPAYCKMCWANLWLLELPRQPVWELIKRSFRTL